MPVGFALDDPRWDYPLVCRKNTTHPEERFPLLWPIVNEDFSCINFEAAPRMTGMITIWSGAIVDIPAGWHLCDGTEGTPDLRDNFIVGAGSTYAPAATGGNLTHRHTGNTGILGVLLDAGSGVAAGTDKSPHSSGSGVSILTSYQNHLPPYYALCYIMHL